MDELNTLDTLIVATKSAYDAVSAMMQANTDYERATDNLILTDDEFNSIVSARRILGKYFRQLKSQG